MSLPVLDDRPQKLTFGHSYTRSSIPTKGLKATILETKTEYSADFKKTIRVSEEGAYEVVAVRDEFCGTSLNKGLPMLRF